MSSEAVKGGSGNERQEQLVCVRACERDQKSTKNRLRKSETSLSDTSETSEKTEPL